MNKNCILTSFVALRMWSEGSTPKNGEKQLIFLHDNTQVHPSVLVKNVSAGNNVTTPEHSP
jgi:hypothetical protein